MSEEQPKEFACGHFSVFDSLPSICVGCGAVEDTPEWKKRREAWIARQQAEKDAEKGEG